MRNDLDRLRKATWRPISGEIRAAQLAELEAAVEGGSLQPQPGFRARRRTSVIAVAAALLVLPAGIAVAAEGSLPGDALYSVKKVTERFRSLVDEDIVAEHRIEELEELVAADASSDEITRQIDRAAAEVNRLGADTDLRPRLDEVTAAVAAGNVGDGPEPDPDVIVADPPGDQPPVTTGTTAPITDASTTTMVPPDRPTTTTPTSLVDSTTSTVRPDAETFRVTGTVHAGPTCPVERFPPDPDCDDLPVAGAVLVIADEGGTELRRVESNAAGQFDLRLPSGSYVLIPTPHDGLLGTADAQPFVVEEKPVELDVSYDTGIR